jgi:hypothetical protein
VATHAEGVISPLDAAADTAVSSLPPPPPRPRRAAALRDAAGNLLALVQGPPPAEEVTPLPVDEPEVRPAASWLARYGRFVFAGVVGGFGSLLIAASAPVYYVAQPTWRLTVPFVPHPGSSASSITTFILGLVLMVAGWLLLIGRSERAPASRRGRVIAVLAVGSLWCVPIMLATPLLSHDAYSYAAQGEMASRGIDPTANGPESLRYGWYLRQADQLWHDAPAPYGPVAIEAEKLAVQLTHHVASASVFGMRVVSLIGIMMAAAGVALIAASYRRSVALALALGIVNPLVLLHLLGGSHNDALMLGFLALGFAAFLRDRKLLAVVLVACAAGVKLTAAPALVFIAWNWDADPSVGIGRRIRNSAIAVGAAAAITAALCWVVGIGVGWISALKATGHSLSTYSLPTKAAYVLTDLLQWASLHPSTMTMIGLCRAVGLLAAAAISGVLLLRSPRIGVVRAYALCSLVIVMLGPVVWPWYLAAGFALLAATGVGRFRPTYVVLLVAATALVWPAGISPLAWIQHVQNGISPLVVGAVIGLCWMAQRVLVRKRAVAEAGDAEVPAPALLDEPEAPDEPDEPQVLEAATR